MAAPRILVIKLGALGDIVQALGPMAAIRRHHADARIVLLTSEPFAEFLGRSPYADEVWIDDRPRHLNLLSILRLRRRLIGGGFARVYDLQTSDRSSFYHRLMGPGARPDWSGVAPGASHRHMGSERERMHTLDRQREQLRIAGIAEVPPPDLSWIEADLRGFGLPERYAVLVPGGAPHRPEKRWPIERYQALAALLERRGVAPVTIGGAAERALGAAIPAARDLTGHTSFAEVAAIGRRALWAIGNDTGPMHLLVAAGAPATVLYSAASDPALTAPRGERVTVLRRDTLADLSVEEVAATLAIG
ncbi:MAG TPA: glycosyltransferase family 9 protein [Stellaceae bacterium]|nr:glycosyltransferase family 9 protein [Stellaceae bacterium]